MIAIKASEIFQYKNLRFSFSLISFLRDTKVENQSWNQGNEIFQNYFILIVLEHHQSAAV